MDYSGKTAVITGGASGIGLATAKVLAGRGANVVLVDMDRRALPAAVQAVKDAAGSDAGIRVESRECDVSSYSGMQALAEDVMDTMGGVHIVFNNAGIAVGGPIESMTHDDWRWVVDVDLWGPIHGVEAFLPHMIQQGQGGHILFTASFAGLVPNVGLGPYCVAKYGVVALAEVLRREAKQHKIGVSVLCPMRVDTNIGASESHRGAGYGNAKSAPSIGDQGEGNTDLAGGILDVEAVAFMVVKAIDDDELYILPHPESREFVQRRFQRIDASYERGA